MTLLDHAPGPAAASATHVVRALQPLVRAEARAEAPAAGLDPADLEQSVCCLLYTSTPVRNPPPDRPTARNAPRSGPPNASPCAPR
nr:hypothetical protein [Streptomyces californicus]